MGPFVCTFSAYRNHRLAKTAKRSFKSHLVRSPRKSRFWPWERFRSLLGCPETISGTRKGEPHNVYKQSRNAYRILGQRCRSSPHPNSV
jgi:hypothetical protein